MDHQPQSLNNPETVCLLQDPRIKLLFLILDSLERSDNLINAARYLDQTNSKQNLDTHTDQLKENFYELFQVYFGEQERLSAIRAKEFIF